MGWEVVPIDMFEGGERGWRRWGPPARGGAEGLGQTAGPMVVPRIRCRRCSPDRGGGPTAPCPNRSPAGTRSLPSIAAARVALRGAVASGSRAAPQAAVSSVGGGPAARSSNRTRVAHSSSVRPSRARPTPSRQAASLRCSRSRPRGLMATRTRRRSPGSLRRSTSPSFTRRSDIWVALLSEAASRQPASSPMVTPPRRAMAWSACICWTVIAPISAWRSAGMTRVNQRRIRGCSSRNRSISSARERAGRWSRCAGAGGAGGHLSSPPPGRWRTGSRRGRGRSRGAPSARRGCPAPRSGPRS